ncbi:unnamed protein product [Ixodes persulcatus]
MTCSRYVYKEEYFLVRVTASLLTVSSADRLLCTGCDGSGTAPSWMALACARRGGTDISFQGKPTGRIAVSLNWQQCRKVLITSYFNYHFEYISRVLRVHFRREYFT